MEALLLGSVIGAGYLLSKDGKQNRQKENNINLFKEPSQNSIYSSNHDTDIKEHEKKLIEDNFEKSKDAIHTNIIPSEFNHKLVNNNTNIDYLMGDKYVSALSGESLDKDNFNPNNTPFFGSHIKQNDITKTNPILDIHTGTEDFSTTKSTPVSLFEPSRNNNSGTLPDNNNIQERHAPSRFKKNELPFEQIQIGPSMDGSEGPSGGFHQDVRKYVIPKTIDEIRPSNNPQISYKGRVVPGKSIGKSTNRPNMEKNRPDTFYLNNPDKYLTSTSVNLKQTHRSHIIAKDTNRKNSAYYSGSAGPALINNQSKRSLYKKSTKQNFKTDGPRNIYKNDNWKNNTFGDYGKKGIEITSNERDITGKRTHTSNITTIVKSLISPVLDVMKPTKKENYEGNVRQTGNLGSSKISKNVAWDPSDVTRTTIKETNIHDNRTGNIHSDQKGVAWDPSDVTRTTIKETQIHDSRTGNIQSTTNTKGTVIDYKNMKFKTTVRETVTPEEINLNMRVNSKLSVKDPNDKAKTTIKETNLHDTVNSNLAGPIKLTVYDPNDIAKTTIKETNEDNSHIGHLGGISTNDGYLTNNNTAPSTHRQFTSDFEYEGVADLATEGGFGYITNKKNAPETHRQFTSSEYEGTANSFYKKPTSQEKSNIRVNNVKEGTLKSRNPTPQGTKVSTGSDLINVETNKIQGDSINTRELIGDKIYNSISKTEPCSITKDKNTYNNQIMDERIEPDLLNAFRNNPYTKSLSSTI